MAVLYGECISDGNKKVRRDRKEGMRKMRCERGGMEGRGQKRTEREKDGVWSQFPPNTGLEPWPRETESGSLGDNQGESQAMSFLCPSPV